MDSPPPPYESIFNTPTFMQQHQHLHLTDVVSISTVPQQAPVILNDCFCSETPREVRRIFIRNLFLMFAAQFLLIDGTIAMLVFVPFVHDTMMDERNSSNFYIIWIVSIIILAITSFCEYARRGPPTNHVTIIISTICHGIALGCTAMYRFPHSEMSLVLLVSIGTTCVVCLATAFLNLQDCYHLGNFRSVLFVWALNATCFGISLPFLTCKQAGSAAGLSTLLCTYLVVNAQMMVRGATRYVLTPKEYLFGALNIYMDIVFGTLIWLGVIQCGEVQGLIGSDIFTF